MADRLHKANIIRYYIATYEDHLQQRGLTDEEVSAQLQWAKEKADWLDPFISLKDEYLDHYDKDKILQPDCPKEYSWNRSGYNEPSREYNFWAVPWWKKNKW